VGRRHACSRWAQARGYVLGLLSQLGCEVFGRRTAVELAARARETLRSLGLSDVCRRPATERSACRRTRLTIAFLVSAGAAGFGGAVTELRGRAAGDAGGRRRFPNLGYLRARRQKGRCITAQGRAASSCADQQLSVPPPPP